MSAAIQEKLIPPLDSDYPPLQAVTDIIAAPASDEVAHPVDIHRQIGAVGLGNVVNLLSSRIAGAHYRTPIGNIVATETSFRAVIDPDEFRSQQQIDEAWGDTFQRIADLPIEVVRAIAEGTAELVH